MTSGRSSASWRAATHSSSSARKSELSKLDHSSSIANRMRWAGSAAPLAAVRAAMSARSRAAIESKSAFTASTTSAARDGQ